MIKPEMEETSKRIINVYFPALMIFFVFTFADNLLKKLVLNPSAENLLFIIVWFFMAVQITLAYSRGIKLENRKYPNGALITDSVDILCALYLCSIMSCYDEITSQSYLHLSVPYIMIAIAQFFWFVSMRIFDIPAVVRLFILFVGMVAISVSEMICHRIWNLLAIVVLIAVLGILRVMDKVPNKLKEIIIKIWNKIKKKWFPRFFG